MSDDDYDTPLFHVTHSGRLEGIASEGLVPGKASSIGTSQYDTHREGAIFLTDPDGVSFWYSRAEEWAHNRSDDLLEDGMIPVVLRTWPDVECEHDAPGTRDAGGAPAWRCVGEVEPDAIEIWSGTAWLPLEEYEAVDLTLGLDDEGYVVDDALEPSDEDMEADMEPNPGPRQANPGTAKPSDLVRRLKF